MITLKLDNQYQVPTRWSELTPEDRGKFVSLCSAMQEFESGKTDFDTFKIRVALALCGVESPKAYTEQMAENMFRISELTSFPFSVKEDKDGKKYAYVEVLLSQNLLPCFANRRGACYGYTFKVSGSGLVDCNLTAEQYIDCMELVQLYSRSWDDAVLHKIFRTLYHGEKFFTPSHQELVAVYYNIRGILEWVRQLEPYQILFARNASPDRAVPESPLGMGASLFGLSKAGYGDIESVKHLDMFTYLGALVQMTVDSILTLKANKLKPLEVAEKLNLQVNFVLPYYAE